jgi:hypothetical protein
MIRAAVVALVLCQSQALIAQERVWTRPGVPGRTVGAWSTKCIGDLNGDGYEEVLAVVHGQCGVGGGTTGFLWLISGIDGTLIREIAESPGGYSSGFSRVAAAGDRNGDGVPDYVVAHLGMAEVRSGVDDSILQSVPAGWPFMVGDIDLDGDGRNDLLCCTWAIQGSAYGRVRAYDHAGNLMYELQGDYSATANPALAFNSIAGLNDVDGDGCDDFALGCFEPSQLGVVVVVSGKNGKFLRFCYGELPFDNIGYELDACGDIDGDGCIDFVATNGASVWVPRAVARVWSSRTGQVLRDWVYPHAFGTHVASRGVDLDGDGVPDVVAGDPTYWSPTNPSGAIYSLSGRDGSVLRIFKENAPPSLTGALGYWMTTMKPPPGENVGFVVVTDRLTGPSYVGLCLHQHGSISLIRGTPRTALQLGPACAGNLTTAPDIGMQSIQGGVRIHLSQAPHNVPAVLLLGLSTTSWLGTPLPLALDPIGLPGCSLRTAVDLMHLTTTSNQTHPSGYVHLDLPYPVPTVGQGTWTLSAQWLVLGDAQTFPGGMSQAMRWRR